MNFNYPYPHEVVGESIIGMPAEETRQTIRGMGLVAPPMQQMQRGAGHPNARAGASAKYKAMMAARKAKTAAKSGVAQAVTAVSSALTGLGAATGMVQHILKGAVGQKVPSNHPVLAAEQAKYQAAMAAHKAQALARRGTPAAPPPPTGFVGGNNAGMIAPQLMGMGIAAAPMQQMQRGAGHPNARAGASAKHKAMMAARKAKTAGKSGATQVATAVSSALTGLGAVRIVNRPVTRNYYYGGGYGTGSGTGYGGNSALTMEELLLLQSSQSYGAYPYGTSPYQNYNYNPYYNRSAPSVFDPYQIPYYGSAPTYPQQPQYQYQTYQQCAGSGGLWDSFANACTGQNNNFNPYTYESTPYGYGGYGAPTSGYAQSMPNVVGLSYGSGVVALNNAGFNVWLLSQDGVPQGNPTNYVQNRAVITVNNNIITSVYQG